MNGGGFTLTAEQQGALALFGLGANMVIEAGAGTGKTSTLKLLAESTGDRGQYLAFNRAIVEEAKAKFPANVQANTAHSLAYRAVGWQFKQRMAATARMKSEDIARILGLNAFVVTTTAGKKRLAPGFLAGQVMKAITNFCQSTDVRPSRRHFSYIEGIDLPDGNGGRTYANNDALRAELETALAFAWSDLQGKAGRLPFKHEHYLKIWQLSDPKISADFVLFDEAQDANPVIADIVAKQTHAQRVYVGDSQQAIYEFTGAVNALGQIETEHRQFLTQSFRFGPAIATVANTILHRLEAPLRLSGTSSILSTTGALDAPRALLCRTNAAAIEACLEAQKNGRTVHLVGGGTEVASFARAAADLMAGKRTGHPELACFESWGEVQAYVSDDPQGSDLALLVGLIDTYGVAVILGALGGMTPEASASLVVSTAHKAKGREWETVKLASDFAMRKTIDDSELRLLYVACTRAQLHLDDLAVRALYAPEPTVQGVIA